MIGRVSLGSRDGTHRGRVDILRELAGCERGLQCKPRQGLYQGIEPQRNLCVSCDEYRRDAPTVLM